MTEKQIFEIALSDERAYLELVSIVSETDFIDQLNLALEFFRLVKEIGRYSYIRDSISASFRELTLLKSVDEDILEIFKKNLIYMKKRTDVRRIIGDYNFYFEKKNILDEDLDAFDRFSSKLITSVASVKEVDNELWELRDDFEKERNFIKSPFNLVNRYAGGFACGEVTIIAGNTGVGKSTILTHIASELWKYGYNVLYVLLEGSEKIIQSKARASIFDKNFYHVSNLNSQQKEFLNKNDNYLFFRKFVSGVHTVNDLYFLIKKIEISKRIKFHLIIIDYPDKFGYDSRYYHNTYQAIGKIYEDIISMSSQEGFATIAVSQVKNEAGKAVYSGEKEFYEKGDLSDSFNKERNVDMVIGLNQTAAERQQNKIRLSLVKVRTMIEPDAEGKSSFLNIESLKNKVEEYQSTIESTLNSQQSDKNKTDFGNSGMDIIPEDNQLPLNDFKNEDFSKKFVGDDF